MRSIQLTAQANIIERTRECAGNWNHQSSAHKNFTKQDKALKGYWPITEHAGLVSPIIKVKKSHFTYASE